MSHKDAVQDRQVPVPRSTHGNDGAFQVGLWRKVTLNGGFHSEKEPALGKTREKPLRPEPRGCKRDQTWGVTLCER